MSLNKTAIETCDFTWNPVTGCSRGCSYCYARRVSETRLKQADFTPCFRVDRLSDPVNRKKPAVIMVCSMGDLLDPAIAGDDIQKVIDVMIETPQHVYLVYTKNPMRYAEFCWPQNAMLGVSAAGSQDEMREILFQTLISTERIINSLFVSFEPLLAPINESIRHKIKFFSFVMIGAQTGPGAAEYAPPVEWVQDIISAVRPGAYVYVKSSITMPETGRDIKQGVNVEFARRGWSFE